MGVDLRGVCVVTYKRCSCGCQYSRSAWLALPLLGVGMGLQMRNCRVCGSTMAVPVTPSITPPRVITVYPISVEVQ